MSAADDIDTAALTSLWSDRWPGCRPIGHELRHCAPDRWVRFHSLPASKRYAENVAEHGEVLRRHNDVLDELHRHSSTGKPVLVITCSWSDGAALAPRDEALEAHSPPSTYWQSILRETDDDWEYWNHLYVGRTGWRRGALDDLLREVAGWRTADVIVTDSSLSWLYAPYDGGADVIVTSPEQRDVLRHRHQNWLSPHLKGL